MIFLGAIAAAALVAEPAASVGSASNPQAVQSVHRYAACVAGHNTLAARALFAMDYRTPEYARALHHLNRDDGDCEISAETERSWQADGLLFAGGIAEALLRRDLGDRDFAQAVAFDPSQPPIEAHNGSEVMAICVVRGDPAGALRLLATEPATGEELAALRAISGLFSGCLPERTQARFSREGLRALIAIAAYRLAVHGGANAG